MAKPLIGVTASYLVSENSYVQKRDYITQLRKAGAEVLLLPVWREAGGCGRLMELLDGLLVPGGWDVSPLAYGEEPLPQTTCSHREDEVFETALIREAAARGKPVLGICRGLQVMNVALGGTLYQDLLAQKAGSICHRQDASILREPTHTVKIREGSLLCRILGQEVIQVNSYHHQAVKEPAGPLVVCAQAPDGVVEACEGKEGWMLGVQWHPELIAEGYPIFERLFRALVEQAGAGSW